MTDSEANTHESSVCRHDCEPIASVIGSIPYRMALAGGWIDQPFVSVLNPNPPGSMVVVSLEPVMRFMERCGMATGTRKVAERIWQGRVPIGDPADLVRELYRAENEGLAEPSGSQDMIGLIYPGVSRLDYRADWEGGYFPSHIETNTDPDVAKWIEHVCHFIPVASRPDGYNPLGIKHLEPEWVSRLGDTGKRCYQAIISRNVYALGKSMNDCMECWKRLLPQVVSHPTINIDLVGLMRYYQNRYAGAMYSGCGGGYLIVVSEEQVPGSFGVTVRLK